MQEQETWSQQDEWMDAYRMTASGSNREETTGNDVVELAASKPVQDCAEQSADKVLSESDLAIVNSTYIPILTDTLDHGSM